MPEPKGPDLVINWVTPSVSFIGVNGVFTVAVQVTSGDEDFEDGVAYRLSLLVCSCGGNPPKEIAPQIQRGNLQNPPWGDKISTITFTVTAGPTPALYEIYAVLLEGPKGVPETDDAPYVKEATHKVLVVQP